MRVFFALILTASLWTCKGTGNTPPPDASATAIAEGTSTVAQDTTAPAPYEGIVWKLHTIKGQKPSMNAPITVVLKRGIISGSGGCNQYTGTYKLDENGVLSISELSSTKRMCNGLMGQESKFLEVLRSAVSIKMDNVELVISSPDGALVFHDKPDAPVKSEESDTTGTSKSKN